VERRTTVIASAIVTATLMTGAVGYAATTAVADGRRDNVGNLQATTPAPALTRTTPPADPGTGAATATTAPRTDPTVSPAGHDDGRRDDRTDRDGDDD
jgi:hypothetical protein